MTQGESPTLIEPPIVEVVCGVKFRPIFLLDAVHHGLYWSKIRDRYPRVEVHRPLAEPNARLVADFPPQRTWFISADDEIVIQVQFDRFYLNWRRRKGAYPRFGTQHERSVLARFSEEYSGFLAFLKAELGVSPVVEGIELSKIDVLERPRHWRDVDDLTAMVPRLDACVGNSDAIDFNLGVASTDSDGAMTTILRTAPAPGGPVLHAEFRLRTAPQDEESLTDCFLRANERVNDAFFTEFPDAEARFGTEVQ